MSYTTKRRLLLALGGLALALIVAGILLRVVLVTSGIGTALRRAGATEIRFHVAQASLWRVVVVDVGFLLGLQPFSAARVTLDRAHWWTPSFGALRIEQAKVTANLAYLTGRSASLPQNRLVDSMPADLPFEQLSIDGQLIIQGEGSDDQALAIQVEVGPVEGDEWKCSARLTGPGLEANGTGRFDLKLREGSFELQKVRLDLKPWQAGLAKLMSLPSGEWEFDGAIEGRASGRITPEGLTGEGVVSLRDGRLTHTAQSLAGEGIEADLEFSDFGTVTTKPGALRARELRAGALSLRDLRATVVLDGPGKVSVTQLSAHALGGILSTEPFDFSPGLAELDAVFLADGISVEEVVALTRDLRATATGRVNGRLPVRIDGDGLQFGTGWLALKPGSSAEIQFKAQGLLTGGSAPGSPGFAVREKIEAGLLKLKISEMRLDIRPPDAPAGRSAQLHIKGEPVDPGVKAPVTLDLNVNGPLEKLLRLGMDSRVSLGGGN